MCGHQQLPAREPGRGAAPRVRQGPPGPGPGTSRTRSQENGDTSDPRETLRRRSVLAKHSPPQLGGYLHVGHLPADPCKDRERGLRRRQPGLALGPCISRKGFPSDGTCQVSRRTCRPRPPGSSPPACLAGSAGTSVLTVAVTVPLLQVRGWARSSVTRAKWCLLIHSVMEHWPLRVQAEVQFALLLSPKPLRPGNPAPTGSDQVASCRPLYRAEASTSV